MTGPLVESEGDQEQVVTNEDKTASEEFDFGFLDDDDSRHHKDVWDESDHSDNDDKKNQLQTQDTAITGEEGEEEKDTFNIPYHWHETTVTFSHARIRDYLKIEGDPSTRRWLDSSVVPDNLNTARLFYENINWIKHLIEIDFCRIPKAAAVQLARQLSTLFYGSQGLLQTCFEARNDSMKAWCGASEFIKTCFSVSKFSTLVRKIIGDYVEEEQRSWALSAVESARKLFQPLMAACVRRWLTKKGWDDPDYLDKSERVVWIIYACITMRDDGNNEGSVEIFNSDNVLRHIALDTLESLANIEPVPKSAHFYAGLAWIMMQAKENDLYYAGDIFNKLGKMAQELQDDSLYETMEASVKSARNLNSDTIANRQPIWLADQLAEWQYHYAPDPQESVETWEKIVTLVEQSNEVVQQSQNWFRSKAAGFLSMTYFNAAKSNFNAGKDASVHIAKMENLAQHKQRGKRYYRASYPALILGLWLHEYIKAREEVWRACIRPSVKQALYMLSDEDPWNDQEAYSQLGKALFAAGDMLNGSIAYGVSAKPLEDRRKALEQHERERDVHKIDVAVNESMLNEAETGEQQGERNNEDTSNHQNTETDNFRAFGEDIGELEEAKDSHQNSYEKGSAQEERRTGGENTAGPQNNEHKGTDTGSDEAIGDGKAEEEEEEGDNNDDNDDNDEEDESAKSVNPK
ncbi:MAG: hypothetical protein Q9171_003471 [Xanthocarpia ochracea]